MMKADMVVTRHPALLALLQELGVADEKTQVLVHVTPKDVRGKVVVGNLPLHLAAEAKVVLAPVLELRPEDRGKELPLETLRDRFRGLQAFRVEKG